MTFSELIATWDTFPPDQPVADRDKYIELAVRCIKAGRREGISFAKVGERMGHTPAWAWQRLSYGNSRPGKQIRRDVLGRDRHQCALGEEIDNLHLHHIKSSRNHSAGNLLTVCPRHHKYLHKLKRDDQSSYKKIVALALNGEQIVNLRAAMR